MNIELMPMRYAHSDGHTDVCYSIDGTRMVTCGTDGDIRIWAGFDDDDPVQTCVGEWSHCVQQKNGHVYVATDSNSVELITYPEGERDKILVRFTAHVNHMAVGKNHNMIAIAAEDWDVRVISIADNEETVSHKFEGLTGPPLSVALCPNAKLLAVTSGDGKLRMWNVNSQELVKQIDCVPKVNSFKNATLLSRIDFEPIYGYDLAYPDKNTIIILNTIDWSIKMTLKHHSINGLYSIVQYSPCGNYVAAVAEKGELIIWQVKTQTLFAVAKHPRDVSISAMVWNPQGNGEIAFCDIQGQFGIAIKSKSEFEATEKASTENKEEQKETNEVDFDGFQFEENESDDEDNENAVSIEKLKKQVMGSLEPDDSESETAPPTPRPRTPEVPLQSTFMPSSTPEHLNPRYLCWNEIGVVRSYGNVNDEEDDGARSIEVEFHDATFHSSMMVQNYQNNKMGSLSTKSLVLANNSQISVLPLSSSNNNWVLSVEENESIICVASSEKLVCFATSNYLVRVCTVYGTHKAVISVPGPLVSMSAHGYYLLIAYHAGMPRKNDQCISVMLVKVQGFNVESKTIGCALGPESHLQWLGFTDVGTPATQDSLGMVCLFPLQSNIWIPFCDTSKQCKSPADGFFLTAVLESSQTIHGIRCRGSIYPSFTPRPTICEIYLQPPFAELGTEKSQLETNLFTWATLNCENTDKKYKEAALKTFALACKSNLDQRALELIEMLQNQQLLTLAIKYASKMDRRRLAEKLMELASRCDTDDDFNDSIQSIATPSSQMRSLRKKLVMNTPTITPKNNTSVQIASASKENTTPLQVKTMESLSTPANSSVLNDSVANTTINSQDSLASVEPKNPFLKSAKKRREQNLNPLSLTDKFAGYDVEQKESNSFKKEVTSSEKRKKPDTDTDKQKDKQRKLDNFFF